MDAKPKRGRPFGGVLGLLVALGVGLAVGYGVLQPREPRGPEAPAVVQAVRESLRLETLQVTLYKKLKFTPEPPQPGESLWNDVVSWARHELVRPTGKAIVFAEARLGYDFAQLDVSDVRVRRGVAEVRVPPLQVVVELKPGETEIIDSSLDSAETAQLLEMAKKTFEKEVLADESLRRRARESVEHRLSALLLGLGLREVRFYDALPPEPGHN